ncbi:rho GTPase-activating protein 28 isoform X5 [Canis lupus baileyi]|uniref:rho GTPase-activating protein 28 isoform X5 n=1 Tax=Canis lupus familiaris TaxID=9615 RepID=UPI0018F6A663|nr:rho GTPase-activating protein 28 isoform X5 [Canis lupus familiaris]XP_038433658.1 rho GTPase-activating protein 28 isoform X5 [Canis lupus familiaris]XP_038528544.1 rho GTPase-activating protein 28 isoform X5 [Canis lupus familiaris]
MLVPAFVLGPERGHARLRMEVEDSGGVVLTAYHSYARSQPSSSEPRCAPRATASHPGSRKSIPRCRRINRMLSNESLHSPAFTRSNSQASIDSTSMEDFLREIESIKENSMGGQEEQIPAEVKPVDEGELEAEWLQDVGLSTLISGDEEEDGKALLSTLTRTQAAAVKKRYNTYTQTMRKKNKQSVRDVRDIFGVSESPPSDPCDSHTAQLDGTQEEKELPGVIKTSGSLTDDASLNSTTLSGGSQDEEGSFIVPRSGSVSILETIPALPVHSNGSPDPGQSVQNAVSDDNYLEKNIVPETEELSFEVSYSEMVTEVPKRNKFKKSDFKKEDYALTKFIVQKTRFGLTEAGDLSAEDMKKIRHLSLIELTAFFDAFGIQLKRNKTEKVKGRDNGIFGVPLTVLLDNDRKKDPGVKVPLVLQKFFEKVEESGLESEGIFRLSGCTAKVKQYREELDAKFNADKFKWDRMCHREAAVMLKAFFRELPTSLFPVEYIPAFITLMERGPHIKVQFQALHLMVMALPDANRDTAQVLMTFFNKVIANESKNRMSIWNISTIMAPNLFFSRSKHSDYEELQLANTAAHIIRLMLKYQKILWKVPSFLIMQVRRMNEATMLLKKQLPSVKKLLRRKTIEREVISPKTSKVLQKSPSSRRMSDVPEGVIRVHAPLLSKVSMAIQLTSHTKAKDILAKFQYENRAALLGSRCLYIGCISCKSSSRVGDKTPIKFLKYPQDGTYHVLYAKKILHLVGKITRLLLTCLFQ